MPGEREKSVSTASPAETVKAVLSAFFGVRRRADHESARLNPVHLVLAGAALVAVFVASLILLVKFIVGRAV